MGCKTSQQPSKLTWVEELQIHECSDGKCNCLDWTIVRLSVSNRTLEIYNDDDKLLELTLGHDLAVLGEQPSQLEFVLSFDDNGTEKFWRVKASSIHQYISCINTLKISSRPPWTSDKIRNCEACEAHFSMLLKRHHCRYCGIIVCNSCSEYEALIPTLGYNSPQRVCKTCWKLLDQYKRRVLRASKISKSVCNAASYLHTIEAERFVRFKEKKASSKSIMSC